MMQRLNSIGANYAGCLTAATRCRHMASHPSDGRSRGRSGKATLGVEEALYLAKEAGYFTTREQQLQIVRSPPFSPVERPFLIENFFDVIEDDLQRPAAVEEKTS